MNLFRFLRPKPTISDHDVTPGLRWLTWKITVSLSFNSITASGIIVASVLALGANNLQIGILAAVPFIMQTIQIPAIGLVEKVRWLKAVAVLSWFPGQLLWFPIALIPVFIVVPSVTAISLLLVLMAVPSGNMDTSHCWVS